MENHLIFCPKCRFYVGAWDKGDYFQCCKNKEHKIIKEEDDDKKGNKNKDHN